MAESPVYTLRLDYQTTTEPFKLISLWISFRLEAVMQTGGHLFENIETIHWSIPPRNPRMEKCEIKGKNLTLQPSKILKRPFPSKISTGGRRIRVKGPLILLLGLRSCPSTQRIMYRQ